MGGKKSGRTSLPDQQEKPNTPRQIQQQGDRVAGAPEQAQHGVKCLRDLARKPWPRGVRDRRVARCRVVHRGFADERRREAPADSDEQEGEDVVEW